MNFAGALFALQRNHRVKRHHWTGYWHAYKDPDTDIWRIMMHTWDGKEIDITDTNDIFYTLSNCACDDWEIIEDWNKETTQPDYMDNNRAEGIIKNAKTIDAEPVKHAHWIDQKHGTYKCSNCGNFLDFRGVNAGRGDANYCPNCGADMRGEQDE